MSTANAKAQQKNCPVERSATVLQRLVKTLFFFGFWRFKYKGIPTFNFK
jgi:hypothetical protein